MPDNFSTQTDMLLKLSSQLNRTDAYDLRLQALAEAAAAITQSDGSSILVFEEETQQLVYAAVCPAGRAEMKTKRIALDKSVAGRAFRQNAGLLIAEAQREPLFLRSIEKSLGEAIRNLLAVPIVFNGQALGTLEVFDKQRDGSYTPDDRAKLELLAAYAGVVIHTQNAEDDALRVSQERLELNQQKTDFIAIASHELRSPLGLILGHATFLRELIHEPIYQNQLDVIIRNAQRLKGIIDHLGQAANFENDTATLRWQQVDLRAILQRITQKYQAEATECAVALSITLPAKAILIHCDPAKLEVAIGNVIKNALIFSDKGLPVQITLDELPGHVRVSVKDGGVGIPAEDLHRIFERFYQVEHHLTRTRGGMGLGLSVTKAIIESHNGQIWVESTPGEGSVFMILLPMVTQNP